MGYTTTFKGQFNLNKKLDDATYNLLTGLASTRRMQRDENKLFKSDEEKLEYLERYNLKDLGIESEFYFPENTTDCGQEDDDSIVDYNRPSVNQPGLWLQWIPTEDRMSIKWNGGEKFYEYINWIIYIIDNILNERGYVLNGTVEWQGEDDEDVGCITITENLVVIN